MITQLEPYFVDGVPETLEDGRLYISIRFKTTSHLCACGCGERVVAKLNPNDWNMLYNGRDITLHPSIGNWSFDCRSHYFVRKNKIIWAGDMTNEKIEHGRLSNANRKKAAAPIPSKPALLEPRVIDSHNDKAPIARLPTWLRWILFWK